MSEIFNEQLKSAQFWITKQYWEYVCYKLISAFELLEERVRHLEGGSE